MPYPYAPYDVPDEAKNLALYQSLLGMGAQMLQPRPYKTNFMGDIGNILGAASQGVSNMGSLLGNYQQAMQQQEMMRLKQAEDARQQQQLNAYVPLMQAQAAWHNAQANKINMPAKMINVNGQSIPESAMGHYGTLLGGLARQSEESLRQRAAENLDAAQTGLGQLVGLPPSVLNYKYPDATTVGQAVKDFIVSHNPAVLENYQKTMEPKPDTLSDLALTTIKQATTNPYENLKNSPYLENQKLFNEGKQRADEATKAYQNKLLGINTNESNLMKNAQAMFPDKPLDEAITEYTKYIAGLRHPENQNTKVLKDILLKNSSQPNVTSSGNRYSIERVP